MAEYCTSLLTLRTGNVNRRSSTIVGIRARIASSPADKASLWGCCMALTASLSFGANRFLRRLASRSAPRLQARVVLHDADIRVAQDPDVLSRTGKTPFCLSVMADFGRGHIFATSSARLAVLLCAKSHRLSDDVGDRQHLMVRQSYTHCRLSLLTFSPSQAGRLVLGRKQRPPNSVRTRVLVRARQTTLVQALRIRGSARRSSRLRTTTSPSALGTRTACEPASAGTPIADEDTRSRLDVWEGANAHKLMDTTCT